MAADVLAENAHLTYKCLSPYLWDFIDAQIIQQTSPEEVRLQSKYKHVQCWVIILCVVVYSVLSFFYFIAYSIYLRCTSYIPITYNCAGISKVWYFGYHSHWETA